MQSIPVQSWNFEHESVIRIGRSTDNHVILYSAVVSRHHVEIRKADEGWQIVNLGANGTYLDGKRITQVPAQDGVIIRLARSGPNVQIHLSDRTGGTPSSLIGEKTLGQLAKEAAAANAANSNRSSVSSPDGEDTATPALPTPVASGFHQQTSVETEDDPAMNPSRLHQTSPCCQHYADSDYLFCLECGKPLRQIGIARDYILVKEIEQDEVSISYLGWKDGRSFILKTLLPIWMQNPEAVALFEREAHQFLTIAHPGLPEFLDVVLEQGQPYLVMHPTYGRSLEQRVAMEGVISILETIDLIQAICEVLTYLHSQAPPILHQRIKPTYLIQRSSNVPVLIIGLTPGRTIAPLPLTSEFIAPEQQQGQASLESDLYALGPTIVYLLTGNSPTAFYANREQGFRFYAEYVPGLTADLVAIVRKLTNPQPAERYGTAQEVINALEKVRASLI